MNKLVLSSEELREFSKSIEGWLPQDEANMLFDTVSSLKDIGCIVEIGSWCGKSLVNITAAALKINFKNKIYSIDPFLTSKDEPNEKYETFVHNLKTCGLSERIEHIKEKSQIVGLHFEDKIEFIFIDGFHKYEAVTRDFELFSSRVVENGYVAIHDIFSYYGPAKLVCDVLENNNKFKYVKHTGNLFICQKVTALTHTDIENNKKMLEFMENYISQNYDRMVK